MILINGQESALVAVHDNALHYGDGLFETLAIDKGRPLALAQHLQRLLKGCERLAIPAPDADLLQDESQALSREQGRGVLKWIISAGAGGGGYRRGEATAPTRIVMSAPWPLLPGHYGSEGIKAPICKLRLGRQPFLAGIKHLNRLEQVLLHRELDAGGFAEGIVLDGEGRIIEGSRSNIFLLKGEHLLTPMLDDCGIDGVIRAAILERAQEWGMGSKVCSLRLDDLAQADEVFFCNSIMGIWPLRAACGQVFNVGPYSGLIRRKLVAASLIAPD